MKKLITGLLGLALVLSISGPTFAKDSTKSNSEISTKAIYTEYEPNNYAVDANPFQIGSQVSGTVSEMYDKDYFKIKTTATQKVNFQLAYSHGTGEKQEFSVILRDENDDLIRNLGEDMDWTLEANKTYYLVVKMGHYYDETSGANHDYTLYTTVLP